MIEKGRIREIRGALIVIVPDKSAACFGCTDMECKRDGTITAENPKGLPVKIGQQVEVQASPSSLLKQALISLLPPVLGFVLGFGLARILFPGLGERTAFIGLLFLFFSAFCIIKIRAKIPAGKAFTVLRIICP